MAELYDVVIIGGGVTGFGAAMYAGRLALKTAVFSELNGGVIITTDDVSNYPGFKKLTGLELAEKIIEHAKDYNIDIVEEKVESVKKAGKNVFEVKGSSKTVHTKTILFATGTKYKKLNAPGEEEFANRGVHYCALCDGAFYKDKIACVVGGSDSAAKDALVLTQFAKKTYILYRAEKIRPEPVNGVKVDAKIKEGKIEIINFTNIKQIKGDKKVTSIILDKPYKGSNEMKMDGVFIAIGHIPLSELAKSIGVQLNQKNEIVINREAKTNIPGVYAAGDVVDTKFKQAITGVAEGVLAAYSAYEYVNEGNEFVLPSGDENGKK